MKKLALLAIMAFMLGACATAKTPVLPTPTPTAKTLGERDARYASGGHMAYSIWGFRDGAQKDEIDRAQKEHWFGEVVQ